MHNRVNGQERNNICFYDLFKEQTSHYDCNFMTLLIELTSKNFVLHFLTLIFTMTKNKNHMFSIYAQTDIVCAQTDIVCA